VIFITGLFSLATKGFHFTDALDLFLPKREAQNLAQKTFMTIERDGGYG